MTNLPKNNQELKKRSWGFLNLENINTRTKLVISFSLLTLLPLLISGYLSYRESSKFLINNALDLIGQHTHVKADNMSIRLDRVNNDVVFLGKAPPIQGIIRARAGDGFDEQGNSTYGQWKERLETIFEGLIETRKTYMQLRYIDENGNELVRVDFDGGESKRVTEEELQNKRDRYYFVNTMKLPKNKIFVSDLDLNREGRPPQIEVPFKPTIRYALPVFDDSGNRKGIVVANVLANSFLEPLQEYVQTGVEKKLSSEKQLLLIDQDGFYLSHPEKSKLWGRPRDLNTGENLSKDFLDNELRSQILSGNSNVLDMPIQKHIIVYSPVFPDKNNHDIFWVILETVPRSSILSSAISLRNTFFVIFLVIIGLILVLTRAISRSIAEPIQQLSAVAKIIDGGDLSARAEIKSKDEVGQLARSFNTMVESLVGLEKYSNTLVNSMPTALITVNPDVTIRSVNPAACELLGYEEEELIGQKEGIFASSNLSDLIREGNVRDLPMSFKAKNGEKIPVAVSGSAVHGEKGELLYIVVAKDLRETKRYAAERLSTVTPILRKISMGDFSESVGIPEEEDEFTGHLVALNLMVDDLRETAAKNIELVRSLEEEKTKLGEKSKEIDAANQQLKAANQQMVASNQQLQTAQKKLQDKVLEMERFNKVAVDRELKMVGLKEELARLEKTQKH